MDWEGVEIKSGFPGGPAANALCSQYREPRFSPWSGKPRFRRLQLGVHTPQLRPSAAKLVSKLIFNTKKFFNKK